MFNKVILIGNLTRDVELRYTPSGTAIAKFGLATNRTYKDSVTGENKQEVMFIDITVFGRSAEIANQYLAKGRRVLIEGRLVLDTWVDSNGQKRSKHSIVAERVQFMDSKASAENSGYQSGGYSNQGYNNQPQQQPQMQPQQTQQNNNEIPSIDIDEDEFPF
ncbi:single-stranded DNA-binding protein [Caminibacter pacificus]|jgi:single-strand DNA-binding protein|uniref:Single-stranded DNA-binding protein n=1 Tax=Caminibacter pacificus TaxID=1424653 RepID=A0AAJ4RDH1_9BACT|nr:single-stranded DNA-binding protein [Caminibacter pacificus]NPA88116.1 single-stranded DNA-binding protein [Campylobacterota bacterium]QCI28696.1 single-stranded DNA-binding protein [Caminibacter pacificus]ROR40571.1 single-strand binding protein [Caminibacter pacificus]